MKKFSISLIALLFSVFSFGQSEVVSIGIMPFEDLSEMVETKDITRIQEIVTSELVKTGRFSVEEGEGANTTYAIFGKIATFKVADVQKDDGTTVYRGLISVTLKIKNCSSGQIIATETITSKNTIRLARNAMTLADKAGLNLKSSEDNTSDKSSFAATFKTPEDAINSAYKGLNKTVSRFVGKHFAVTAKVVDIVTKKGKEAEEILILIGQHSGLTKGTKIEIFAVSTITVGEKTHTRKQSVGHGKLTRFEGDFAVCMIRKGGEAVLQNFSDKHDLIGVKE